MERPKSFFVETGDRRDSRLCLPFDTGSSHDKGSKVLQNFLYLAAHSLIFIDLSVILML